MPKTEAVLSNNEKHNWQEFCQSHSMSEAEMLRMMIHKVAPEAANACQTKQCRTNKITIRLSTENVQKLDALVQAEGYLSQTSWVTSAVMANLIREPVLTKDEMSELRDSNRQLAAIGRNLNQIARVLNIEFRYSDKITREMIEMLETRINKHTDKVYQLLCQNQRRWGINNE
ncbi:plasmid mobilization relaxosome protein MobC [Parashewanella curva]|uniref:Plasmid mobilization relaxosome protein MobC n=1 Tax=Parashewanella curva TaxID=2338552 RepID=A0A3L8PVE6_9GAMM|nr:plasmid mobilization relaxosome protein MobC [Parashewanella curva]RLV58553.1 plasmid mobilization relaxosome protein MobC [Parashewanella curva]